MDIVISLGHKFYGQIITITIISLYPINFVWCICGWGKILRDNIITISNISLYPLSLYPLYTVPLISQGK